MGPRGRFVGILCMLALFGWMALSVLADAKVPSGYKGAHMRPGEVWIYPSEDVQFALTAMTIELLVVVLALGVPGRVSAGARAALCGGLYFCALLFFAPFAMHATKVFGDHLVYLLLGIVFLIGFAITSAIVAVVRKQFQKPSAIENVFD